MIKYIILTVIKLYWNIIPVEKRYKCIFIESCSRYVYRITIEEGFWAGIKAFKSRYKKCRPGYKVGYNSTKGTTELHLVDGTILQEYDFKKKS